MKALYLTALVALSALAAGCSAPQGRSGAENDNFNSSVDRETYLHGTRGFSIARTYNKSEFRQKMAAEPQADNVLVEEFFTVRVCRDHNRRDQLTDSGYARRRLDRESGAHFYEFFDLGWKLIAYLDARGELHVPNQSGTSEAVGRYQVDDALILVYGARGGFTYDQRSTMKAAPRRPWLSPAKAMRRPPSCVHARLANAACICARPVKTGLSLNCAATAL